jgi:hypothetical protein
VSTGGDLPPPESAFSAQPARGCTPSGNSRWAALLKYHAYTPALRGTHALVSTSGRDHRCDGSNRPRRLVVTPRAPSICHPSQTNQPSIDARHLHPAGRAYRHPHNDPRKKATRPTTCSVQGCTRAADYRVYLEDVNPNYGGDGKFCKPDWSLPFICRECALENEVESVFVSHRSRSYPFSKHGGRWSVSGWTTYRDIKTKRRIFV